MFVLALPVIEKILRPIVDEVVEGKSTTLIERGKVIQKNLARKLLTGILVAG
jgi:uncharacterized membrane protein YcaP (DUF421 family)